MRTCLLLFPALVAMLPAAGQSTWSVEALDIRPAGDDFGPALVDSGLVITSVRERAQAVAYTDARTGTPLADLYMITLTNGQAGHPRLLDGSLSTPLNDGPASFSPGGDTICITRNIVSGEGKRRSERLGLFFAVRRGGIWSEVEPFAWNGDQWSVMHGSFSADGRTLWFASDKPGGTGGADLYMSVRNGDGWGMPQNLGPAVNGPGNELFPNMDAAGVLHFASDRPGSLGKLDIYACAIGDHGFSKPAALPAPVNSEGNDLGWAPHADGISGYFGSDREGKGRIYRFTQRPLPFQDCVEQKPIRLCFAFEDEGSFNTDSLPLRYEWDFGDGQRQAGLSAVHCYSAPGTYEVKLNIVDTLSESVYFNQTSYPLEAAADEQAVIGGPDSVATGAKATWDAAASNLPGFTAKEVHWELGDGSKLLGPLAEHAWAAPGNYRITMDLIGGPDGEGGFTHHCVYRDVPVIDGFVPAPPAPASAKAAAQGARSTFNYSELPQDPSEASAQALGNDLFSVQLFTSATRVGLNDARFIQLRKTYAITERFLAKERLYTYSIGSAKTPQALFDAYGVAKRQGFIAAEVTRMPKEKPLAMERVEGMALSELDNGMISVSRVLYGTGKTAFDGAFQADLGRVLDVLRKYPQVELVIEAHTDDVGSETANMALSESRAQGIMDWFIQAGIAPARLLPLGFGEARPVADNGSETGRAANRRVEFRLNVPETTSMARP
jgi:outer membrane protein OmpA-like peptidoglycan-associated protein